MCSFVRSFVLSFLRSFVRSIVRSYVRSSIRLFVRAFFFRLVVRSIWFAAAAAEGALAAKDLNDGNTMRTAVCTQRRLRTYVRTYMHAYVRIIK